jgi:hypothetical protein
MEQIHEVVLSLFRQFKHIHHSSLTDTFLNSGADAAIQYLVLEGYIKTTTIENDIVYTPTDKGKSYLGI